MATMAYYEQFGAGVTYSEYIEYLEGFNYTEFTAQMLRVHKQPKRVSQQQADSLKSYSNYLESYECPLDLEYLHKRSAWVAWAFKLHGQAYYYRKNNRYYILWPMTWEDWNDPFLRIWFFGE